MRYALSVLFTVQAYFMMLIWGLVFAPWALFSPTGARTACRTWASYAMWTARLMIGLRTEVRGTPPTGEVLVAAKHQSFLDILMIFNAVPTAKFIMKRELLYTPIIGIYAYRLGCVPVSRGKRGAAIAKMVADVEAGRAQPGQLVIYPQGTRVAPGAHIPYKVGTAILYEQLAQPCVPVATNAGLFWPRKGLMRHPGLAVVEFLEPMATGTSRDAFMAELEEVVEARSNTLMAEAGFDANR
ncbi:MAG: lysophospholipid acyltransferase family protein [Pseudomonadota bacterium]